MQSCAIKKILLKNVLMLCIISCASTISEDITLFEVKAEIAPKAGADTEKLNQEIAALQQQITKNKQDSASAAAAAANQLSQAKAAADKAEKEKNDKITSLNKQISDMQKSADTQKKAISDKEAEIKKLQSDAANLKKQSETNAQALTKAKKDAEAQFNKTKKEQNDNIATLNKKMAELKTQLETEIKKGKSKDSVEATNLILIDSLTTSLNEARQRYEELTQAAQMYEKTQREYGQKIAAQITTENTNATLITQRTQEMVQRLLQEIDSLRAKQAGSEVLIKTLVDNGRALEVSYNQQLDMLAKSASTAKDEYSRILASSREAEINNFVLIDKLMTDRNSLIELNKQILERTKAEGQKLEKAGNADSTLTATEKRNGDEIETKEEQNNPKISFKKFGDHRSKPTKYNRPESNERRRDRLNRMGRATEDWIIEEGALSRVELRKLKGLYHMDNGQVQNFQDTVHAKKKAYLAK